jgi:hypothetical protein
LRVAETEPARKRASPRAAGHIRLAARGRLPLLLFTLH